MSHPTQCDCCEFYQRDDRPDRKTDTGLCRRRAPVPGDVAQWPVVQWNDYCGEGVERDTQYDDPLPPRG